jgi:hypothetical protein
VGHIISSHSPLISGKDSNVLQQPSGVSSPPLTTLLKDSVASTVPIGPKATNKLIQAAQIKPKRRPKWVLHPPNQLTLFDVQLELKRLSQEGDTWGHSLETISSDKVFRVVTQNMRGLKLYSDPLMMQYSLQLSASMGIASLCLSETNLNWIHKEAHSKLNRVLKKVWQHASYSTSHIVEDFQEAHRPGGTATLVTGNWVSRIITKGTDPYGLGRWSYVVLLGRGGQTLLVVSAYRVCKQAIQSAGPTTVTAQQYRHLSRTLREANSTEDPAPHCRFILDLQAWLEHHTASSTEVILCIDANEAILPSQGIFCPLQFQTDKPIKSKGNDGSMQTLLLTCGLADPLLIQYANQTPPSTYSRGSHRIDYVFVSRNLLPFVL